MERSTTTPEEFIASLPDEVRPDIAELDRLIAGAMPGQVRVLWEGVFWGGTQQRIIGYGEYRSVDRSGGEVEWFKVGLARQKDHISLYVNAVADGRYLVQAYVDRLGKAQVGSANVSFKRLADIDEDALLELVRRAASEG
jgi:hypothetical protein